MTRLADSIYIIMKSTLSTAVEYCTADSSQPNTPDMLVLVILPL